MNQVGEKDCGLEWIADDVAESAPGSFPGIRFQDVLGAAGMFKDRHLKLIGLRPERIKLGVRQGFTIDMSAKRGAAEAEGFDRVVKLPGGEVRKLHRGRSQADEAIWVSFAPRRYPGVGRTDNLFGQGAIFHPVPPVAIDAYRLHINSAPIHFPNAFGSHGPSAALVRKFSPREKWLDLGDGDVRVNIHHADATSSHLHDAALHRAGGRLYHKSWSLPAAPSLCAGIQQATAYGEHPGRRTRHRPDKRSPMRHSLLRYFQFTGSRPEGSSRLSAAHSGIT